MTAAAFPFFALYTISLLISCSVGVYAWRRRKETGASAYALLTFSQASWTFGFILETISPGFQDKIFWDNFQFIGGGGWLVCFVAFANQFTGRRVARPGLLYGLLSLPFVAVVGLAYTDPLHGLIRINPALVAEPPLVALVYDFTVVDWVWTGYSNVVFLTCVVLMLSHFIRSHRLFRTQVILVLIGNLIPAVGTLVTVVLIPDLPLRDISPFTFAAGNLIVAWGLFRYQLFGILPVARDAIIENLKDPVFVLDAQRRLIDLNPAARTVLGRVDTQVIGQPAEQVFKAWPNLLDARLVTLGVEQTEAQVDTPQGRRYIELRIQPLSSRQERLLGYLIISRDITARKEAEEGLRKRTAELEEANLRLEELGRVKDEFVANVSHELRTPLTSMKLNMELMTARPERRDAYLTALSREIQRLENMIEGLLMLSRFDQDHMDIRYQRVDLNHVAEQYVVDRAALAEERGLSLSLDPTAGLPALNVDPALIGQALSVLLTNAINYTPAGGQVVVQTRTAESNGQRWVGVCVSDTGPGVPEKEQTQMFSRFFRGSAGRKSRISGAGLGLALAREIVERFDGRIEVESEGQPGKGSVFRLWLPEPGSSHAED